MLAHIMGPRPIILHCTRGHRPLVSSLLDARLWGRRPHKQSIAMGPWPIAID